MTFKVVRRPRVDVDLRGYVQSHGLDVPKRGVWHDTESSDAAGIRDIQGIADFWHRQDKGYGAHIIIDEEGNSGLCANMDQITWAVANRNTGTVSIELIGFARFVPSVWLARPAQLDKLAKWMAWINLEWDINLRFDVEKGWSGHRDQPNQTHTDPGPWFPKSLVLTKARRYRAEGWM